MDVPLGFMYALQMFPQIQARPFIEIIEMWTVIPAADVDVIPAGDTWVDAEIPEVDALAAEGAGSVVADLKDADVVAAEDTIWEVEVEVEEETIAGALAAENSLAEMAGPCTVEKKKNSLESIHGLKTADNKKGKAHKTHV